MIINLTQHQASAEQLAAGVVDLPAAQRVLLAQSLTVDTLPTRAEIADRCANIAALAVHNGLGGDESDDPHPTAAMIGGAPWMMAELERALLDMGVPSVYAFSVRESAEQPQPDGSVRKVNVFRHAGFVDAGTTPR
jgi:hypothetical protein